MSFSPKEKEKLVDAHTIGASNDMEIIGIRSMEDGEKYTLMLAEDHDDDLLGEELMEMETETIKEAAVDEAKIDKAKHVKPRATSSHRSGGRSGISLGLQIKKVEFLVEISYVAQIISERDISFRKTLIYHGIYQVLAMVYKSFKL